MLSTQLPRTPPRPREHSLPNTASPSRRSYGTPRRRKTPISACLQGVKKLKITINKLSEDVVSKLQLPFTPDPWQIHLIPRIQQGYDCIFVAGTGYGKSLIFEGLAATGGAEKTLVIISPLKALERDQVGQASQKGLKAIHINEDNTKTAALWKEAKTTAQMIYLFQKTSSKRRDAIACSMKQRVSD
ncbi:hypothetical protein H0H92_011038 [Tricholoma furcatifolium]|nr:hypothetical protein H0H92_011038 [Tricholoma furcatifolium]